MKTEGWEPSENLRKSMKSILRSRYCKNCSKSIKLLFMKKYCSEKCRIEAIEKRKKHKRKYNEWGVRRRRLGVNKDD